MTRYNTDAIPALADTLLALKAVYLLLPPGALGRRGLYGRKSLRHKYNVTEQMFYRRKKTYSGIEENIC